MVMDNIEQLKQLKELLDSGVINQEEFDRKKAELLAVGESMPVSSGSISGSGTAVAVKKKVNTKVLKRVLIIVIVVAVVIAGVILIAHFVNVNKRNTEIKLRAEALQTEIAPIMGKYGLNTYKVEYVDYAYDVFAEGFGDLTNGQALACLKELDRVSIEDPCGGGYKIDFGMTNVHPGMDVEYSYWRVSTYLVDFNKENGGNYKVPGIYCNRYGIECVFEYDN